MILWSTQPQNVAENQLLKQRTR